MLAAYGTQWERSYGHVDGPAFKEWGAAMQKLPDMSIKHGLEQLLLDPNLNPEFPPNLIKFLRLCRSSQAQYPYARTPAPPKQRLNHQDPGAKARCFEEARDLLGDWPEPKDRHNET